jgi:hypothetical protein
MDAGHTFKFWNPETGSATWDNTPIYRFVVNSGGSTLEPAQSVFGVYDYQTPLFKVEGSGVVTAKAGVQTSVADGYRRVNFCNTGTTANFLFTPQAGDIACAVADNIANLYIYDNNTWTQISKGETTGGGVTKMLVTDNFNRTNQDPISTPWAVVGSDTLKILSNEVAGSTSAGGLAYYTDNTFASAQYAQVKITSPVTELVNGGACVRMSTASGGNAYCAWITNSTEAKIFQFIAGSWSSLDDCTGTFAENDILRIEASGYDLTVKLNGSILSGCSALTDGTLITGRPGIVIDGADFRIDDFEGGDL